MGCYISEIEKLAETRNALKEAVGATSQARHQSVLKYRDWEIAAAKFLNHASPLDPLIAACYDNAQTTITPNLREFMFDYIAVDPQFFRSGYLMERILRRVKRLDLSAEEKTIIRSLLLNRTKHKALRNYRHICRLLPLIADAEIKTELEELSRSQNAGIRHRARFALSYLPVPRPSHQRLSLPARPQ